MIKIEAFIREDKLEDVKDALNVIGVHGMTIYQVMGCGVQKGYIEVVRGNEIEINMLPKIKMEVIVADESCQQTVISTIQKAAYTGNHGDGKIISYALQSAIRIRTGETGKDAIY